jgi:hypothetical protein
MQGITGTAVVAIMQGWGVTLGVSVAVLRRQVLGANACKWGGTDSWLAQEGGGCRLCMLFVLIL